MLDVVYYHTALDTVMAPDMLRKTPDGRTARGFWPQPLPDFKNPRTRSYLIESLVRRVRDFGADGFRCDVAAGVPVDFWDDARKALDRVNPGVILLSEDDRFEDQLRAFDINYNFNHYLTLRSVLRDGEPAIRIREHWEKVNRTFPRGARMLHYSDNHDWRRAVLEFGDKGAFAAAVLNFTLDGIPFLYNGQEIGDRTPTHWTTSAPIPWQGEGIGADYKQMKETLERYRRLLAARAQHPALTSGELIWVNNTEPDSVLSFLRKKGDEEVLVILNLSNRKVHVALDLPVMEYYSVENLLKDGKTWFDLYSGRVSAHLAAYEEVVGKRIPLEPLKP
jgi:glycosidase